ncbi:DUF397 domain-containing protein [Actinomadura sp. NBRC 104425]|uniref:DUF397 domain-containing protein n=1 Tax=Actinomadura sp. NBRC 104425 TaxID=3032204 RepID=UPI0025527A1D|nr:DUF397 domain-containing protein [Actinomadura sp. NBRC 104425]
MHDISWRNASCSQGIGGERVEVARVRPGVAVRDSKDPSGPVLMFGRVGVREICQGYSPRRFRLGE